MSNGSKILKWILLSPVVLVLLGIVFCEINKAYWDHQVKLMCEKDGGVTVYEKIELTKLDRKNIKLHDVKYARPDDKYFSTFSSKTIRKGFPEMIKGEFLVYRTIDKKIIGRQIGYGRVGGDFPTGFHPSSFSCDQAGVSTQIEPLLFEIKGE